MYAHEMVMGENRSGPAGSLCGVFSLDYERGLPWASYSYKVRVIRTDAKAMFIHAAFAQHCAHTKVRISHSSPYLKETNG